MFEFLSDPNTQFVIVTTLTILAVIGPIIVYLKQRARKSLQFRIISRTALFSVKEEAKGEIEITYRGTKVEDAYLVLIEVSNVGDVPIRTEDFVSPITFDFGESAQVLTAEVTKREPEDLSMQVTISGKTISLVPALMNTRDLITLKVIATKIDTDIEANCRIVGVKKLEEAKPKMPPSIAVALIFMIVGYVSLFSFIFSVTNGNYILGFLFLLLAIGSLAVSLSMATLELARRIQSKLRKRSRAITD